MKRITAVRYPRNVDLAVKYGFVCSRIVEESAIIFMMRRIILAALDIHEHFEAHGTLLNADLPGIGRETREILEDIMRVNEFYARHNLVVLTIIGEATEHLLTVPAARHAPNNTWRTEPLQL